MISFSLRLHFWITVVILLGLLIYAVILAVRMWPYWKPWGSDEWEQDT